MYTIKDILRIQVAPALGCTEPAAVALCCAAAKSLIPENKIESIKMWVDPKVYKNGMGVNIPGTKGEYGIDVAAALGALCGDSNLCLEVLQPVNEECVFHAKKLCEDGKVSVQVDNSKTSIFIHAYIKAEGMTSEAYIEDAQDNITKLVVNNSELETHPLLSSTKHSNSELEKLEQWLKNQSLDTCIELCEQVDNDDIAFIEEGLQYNCALAKYGKTYGCGLGVGKTLERLVIEGLIQRDMTTAARILTASASDARMGGAKLPAMSSAGSGNHGLTAILPIWAIKDFINIPDKTNIIKAIVLSHIITAYIKAFTGRLSALCGCSIAAGAGATAGIAYLMGGNISHISGAIKNLIEDLAGVICDGAKDSCALKLSTAAGTAVQSALFSLHGIVVTTRDGIVGKTAEQTMKNIGKLSTDGMIEADRTILKIMIDKSFSNKK